MEYPCIYSIPLNASGTAPTGSDFWQYSQATCTISYIEQYQSGTSTFYLSSVIDAGEVILIVFVMIFFVFAFVKSIWNFFLK